MWRGFCAGIRANVPTIVWGDPGRGKTAKIESAGRKSGYDVETILGSVRESTDYLGLPFEKDGATSNLPPDWAVSANAAPKAIRFLDEFNTASTSTMKAQLRVLQERYVGQYKIGDHVRFAMAANPPETGVDAWELPPPAANRMLHLDWHFDADEWLDNIATGFAFVSAPGIDDLEYAGTDADRARAASWVSGFLRSRRDLLEPPVPTDPAESGKAWPSPRSWANVIDVLTHLPADDDDAIRLVVKGLVGEGAASAFFAWMVLADLHDPAEVLANPSIVDWAETRPDRLYGLLKSIEALVLTRGDARTWEQGLAVLVACGQAGKKDVALPTLRALINPVHRPTGTTITPEAREIFTDLLGRTQHGVVAAQAPVPVGASA